MTRLILVRHGQSLANAQERFAGHSDFDLSELGQAQAALTAKYLFKNERIDKIYSSDLSRAYNTARPCAEAFGLQINSTPSLREIFAGDWEGLTVAEISEKFALDFDIWKKDFSNARCTGGESVEEVYERVKRTVCKLAQENDGKCILLTTHATVVRAFTCYSLGLSAKDMASVPFCHNAAVNVFTYEDGKSTVVKTNIYDFLEELPDIAPTSIEA